MEDWLVNVVNVITRDISYIDSVLSTKDNVREEIIRLTRSIIRSSGMVIHSVHRDRFSEARVYLSEIRKLVDRLLDIVEPHPDLKYTGLIYSALSEYVEAYMFYSIVVDKTAPALIELKTPIIPYLQGLGDLIGELRRLIIRFLNELKVEEAEKYLDIMENIYDRLKTLEYPDPLIPGVRHKIDIASRIIEDTRVLVLTTKNSMRYIESIKRGN